MEYGTSAAVARWTARGIASLEAHATYLAAIPGHPAPANFIPTLLAMNGRAMGVDHAVLFRARDLQALPAFLTDGARE